MYIYIYSTNYFVLWIVISMLWAFDSVLRAFIRKLECLNFRAVWIFALFSFLKPLGMSDWLITDVGWWIVIGCHGVRLITIIVSWYWEGSCGWVKGK
jgi:hypothetical protein